MGNLVTDVILADEIRAGQTLLDWKRGKAPSASALADAAVTLGSDALMFVPGLGAAAVAAKAARVGRVASKSAKVARAAKVAQAHKIDMKRQAIGLDALGRPKLAAKFAKRSERAAKVEARLNKTVDNLRKTTGTKNIKQDEALAKAMHTRKMKAIKKRNSPKRKKLRYTGTVSSTTKDILDAGKYTEEEY